MSARGDFGRGTGAQATIENVQQLRERVLQLVAGHGQQPQQQEYLRNFFSKWSAGKHRINFGQFVSALQSLSLPMYGAHEVFNILDRDSSGAIDIVEFCDAMLAGGSCGGGNASGGGTLQQHHQQDQQRHHPPPFASSGKQTSGSGNARHGTAMRSAGTAMLGNGRELGGYTPTSSRAGSLSGRPPSGRPALAGTTAPTGPCIGNGHLTPSQSKGQKPSVRVMSATSARSSKSGRESCSSTAGGATRSGCEKGSGRGQLATLSLSDILLQHFKSAVLQRCGAGGIHALGRAFKILDTDGSRAVNLSELTTGINDVGLHLEPKDIQLLLAAMDKNNTGSLTLNEFLVAVRGDINPRREALINMAFDIMDRTGDGRITIHDVQAAYDGRHHPEVISGQLGEDRALSHFLSQFDSVERDGCVTRREFLDYYRSVSSSIDDDDYFELMIRNAWHISGGQGQYQNTSNKRVLVTFDDGSQEIAALEDRGLDLHDGRAVRAQLEAQGFTGIASYSLGD